MLCTKQRAFTHAGIAKQDVTVVRTQFGSRLYGIAFVLFYMESGLFRSPWTLT